MLSFPVRQLRSDVGAVLTFPSGECVLAVLFSRLSAPLNWFTQHAACLLAIMVSAMLRGYSGVLQFSRK
jgi:hypothetical protein